MPVGSLVRKSFSFSPGEKSLINRRYRKFIDWQLTRMHEIVDFLFAMPTVEQYERMRTIISFARRAVVEMETHPVNPHEFSFLMSGELFSKNIGLDIAPSFTSTLRNLNTAKEF